MKTEFKALSIAILALVAMTLDAHSRGFGGGGGGGGRGGGGGGGGRSYSGGGGGGFSGGSYSRSSDGGSVSGSFSGSRGGSYGSESASGSYQRGSSGDARGGSYSYNKDYTTSRGGSAEVSGSGGAVAGPNGAAAGRQRDVTATTAGGRTVSGSQQGGAAVGPNGNVVGGSSRAGVATGPNGSVAGASRAGTAIKPGDFVIGGSKGAAVRLPTDGGLARYSSAGTVSGAHSTQLWSHNYVSTQATYVRAGFTHYDAFTPGWSTAHPGAWAAAGFVAGSAWSAANWSSLYGWCALPSEPVDYDYGNTIVYQDDQVYVNGADPMPAEQYAAGVQTVANRGRAAEPATDAQWQSLGVFALVQGTESASNNIFQLAVDPNGVIRGNYYDALTNTTTPVFGSVDKPSQRAAWSIGEKKDTVFEAGVYNLTKDQTSVLVHMGTDKTQQMMLVRMQQPDPAQDPSAQGDPTQN